MSTPPTVSRLEEIITEMAEEVRPWIQAMDRKAYLAYLDAMYHYAHGAKGRFRFAVQVSDDDSVTEFFEQLASDEASLHRLAEQDLKALGSAPSGDAPDAVVQLDEFWESHDEDNQTGLAGAIYVLEGVSTALEDDFTDALKRLELRENETRYVHGHLVTDSEHGDRSRDLCARLGKTQPKPLFNSARAAADLWIEIHRECLGG